MLPRTGSATITVEERRRIELFERLVPLLGEEAATTMLELLPPPGQDVATKDDVARLREDLARLEDRVSGLVTKEDLREALGHYATKEDLREALGHYATKADLQGELRLLFTAQTVALAAVLGAAAAFFG